MYLRSDWDWFIPISSTWWILCCSQLSMDVAIQFVVEVVITLVLQRGATSSTSEAFSMKILVLDANKHSAKEELQKQISFIKQKDTQKPQIQDIFMDVTHTHNTRITLDCSGFHNSYAIEAPHIRQTSKLVAGCSLAPPSVSSCAGGW